ncbi:hypothetical protein ElP_71790 (plasmid) [Tautonia plasticadhaerens]|uniref:Uncharacterized protein n=1 Tax=Tautonia plasticadhaerens TaxID=2527974 RepID=A0A518HEE8_9BACT|nr:hypothetical protein ElP_71790 [Tautonia plasticadhaerens]
MNRLSQETIQEASLDLFPHNAMGFLVGGDHREWWWRYRRVLESPDVPTF